MLITMTSAITRYSPHYLMFGYWLHLPINFYFPTIRGMEKHWCVDYYIADICEQLWEAFKEVQTQSTSEAKRQKPYYDRKANAILLETGLVLSWLKPMPTRGRGMWRTGGRRNHMKWNAGHWWHSLIPCEESVERMLMSPPPKLTFSHHSYKSHSSLYSCASWVGRVCHQCPRGTNSR